MVRDQSHYTAEYRGVLHSICILECSVPRKIPIAFHNECNCNCNLTIKEFAEVFKKQLTYLGENAEKYIIFTVPIEKEVTRIDKNWAEILQKLIAQDLWQAHCQISSIIFWKNS